MVTRGRLSLRALNKCWIVFDRRILWRIYGSVRIEDGRRILLNHELYKSSCELYKYVDIVRFIKAPAAEHRLG